MSPQAILLRIRSILDLKDDEVLEIFRLGGVELTLDEVGGWLQPSGAWDRPPCSDAALTGFLDGLIMQHRGPRGEPAVEAVGPLTNNRILRKLKIAFALRCQDVVATLALAHHPMTERQVTALLRKKGHRHYRECKDRVLESFLRGLHDPVRGAVRGEGGRSKAPIESAM